MVCACVSKLMCTLYTHGYDTCVHRGVRATKGWKRALNAHLGKGVAFATVVDSAATTHTPPQLSRGKKKIAGTERERRWVGWKPEDSVIEALIRASTTILSRNVA